VVSLVDPAPWVPLIGRLFIAFGGIERTTHECIRKWAGDTIHKHFARSPLSARLALAADLAESRDASETMKQEFKDSLLQARDLARRRNLVAHNPLCLVLLQDGIESYLLEAIASNMGKDEHMSLSELEEVVRAAEQCSAELSHRFSAFRVANIDFELLKTFPGFRSTGDA
jgi:hypothetical protein